MTQEAENEDWYGPDMATFGDRIAAARLAAGLTQSALAKRLGVQLKTLRNWEEDLSEPRANRLSMMAGVLNVSITWLIHGEGDGLQAPPQELEVQGDLRSILGEIRKLQTDLKAQSDQAGRLEKRLRKLLSENT